MTKDFLRVKPDPIPAIHPVSEYRAKPELTAIYDETKRILRVPWMGVVAMGFAHYPQFWRTFWSGLRPLAQSREFDAAAKRLRQVTEAAVKDMAPPPILADLRDLGYGAREINQIRDVVEVFSAGNHPYLLMATLARLVLENHDLSEARATTGRRAPAHPAPGSVTLMEPHHADPATKKVYADIQHTLGLPFVNTDYRALARWPSYFGLAWSGVKPVVGSVDYLATVEMVHRESRDLVLNLPNPGRLNTRVLVESAALDATPDEVRDVVRLFQWLLPGLVTNVALLRAQLRS